MTRGATAGGAAGAGGFSFQDSVAAWAAVGILGEQAVTPRWELAPTTYLTEIRCETGLALDDLAAVTSAGGAVYIQVKRALHPASLERRRRRLPSSRGTLMIIRPVLRPRRDRAGSWGPGVSLPDAAPAADHGEDSTRRNFGAQSHGV